MDSFVPASSVVQLIQANIKTTVETSSEAVIHQCRRITEGLRLAEGGSRTSSAQLSNLSTVWSLRDGATVSDEPVLVPTELN